MDPRAEIVGRRGDLARYVNASAPKGVFLAIQSRSACTLVGDHGSFVSMSPDLGATAGCSSGVFSKTSGGAFSGHSTVTWKASVPLLASRGGGLV